MVLLKSRGRFYGPENQACVWLNSAGFWWKKKVNGLISSDRLKTDVHPFILRTVYPTWPRKLGAQGHPLPSGECL